MKKLISILLCLAIIMVPVQILSALADDASYISVSYNPDNRKLTVKGREALLVGNPVIIHLIYGAEVSESAPPVISELVFTGENGDFSLEAKVPSSAVAGEYTVYVGSDARDSAYKESIILFFKNSQATKDALALINGATTYTEFREALESVDTSLGLDMEKEPYADVFSEVLYGVMKSDGGFTVDEFTTGVAYARGCVIISTEKNVAKAMQSYGEAFDYSYALYEGMDAGIRTKADELICKIDMNSGYISYSDLVIVAEAVCAMSYGELKDIITKNADAIDVDLGGKYAKLDTNNKSKVFKMIFSYREDFVCLSDIKGSFDEAVKSLQPQSSSGGIGGSGGGASSGDSRGHVGQSTVISDGVYTGAVISPQSYTDIENSFARENIIALSGFGIIKGYDDGTFRPKGKVTRAEFSKLVCLSFGLSSAVTADFDDVSDNDWFYDYVSVLGGIGIVRGDGANFYPDSPITRQDAAVIVALAATYSGMELSGTYSFVDEAEISDYARGNVSALAANGFLKGDGTNFYPLTNITREEAAALIYRLYTALN